MATTRNKNGRASWSSPKVPSYAQGGFHRQGFDARLDEAMAGRGETQKGKKMSMKGRRDVSKGVRKAAGGKPYGFTHKVT
jgi:hypothetical protein